MKKVLIVGVDGVFPFVVNGFIDHRAASLLIPDSTQSERNRADIVITRANSVERFESLIGLYPNASVALFLGVGYQRVVMGKHAGKLLWQATTAIFREKNEVPLQVVA